MKPNHNDVKTESKSNDEGTETVEAFDPKEAEKNLSSKVTEDYLPGTYKSFDGKYFAIKIDDESVLNITMPELAKIFNPDLSSTCKVYDSENAWLTDAGEAYVIQHDIIVLSTTYTYELKGIMLELTNDETGETKTYKKISDEYKPKVLMDKSSLNADIVAGTYVNEPQQGTGFRNNVVKIEKVSDKLVNIYFYFSSDFIADTSNMMYLAENVPVEEFFANGKVYLKGENDCTVDYIKFISLNMISDEIKGLERVKSSDKYSSLDSIPSLKSLHPEINYDYSSYDEIVTAKGSIDGYSYKFTFNSKWYKYYNEFTADGYIEESNVDKIRKLEKECKLTVKSINETQFDLYLNGIKYDTFNSEEFKGFDRDYVQYDSSTGASFQLYEPDINDPPIKPEKISLFVPQGYSEELSFAEGRELIFVLPGMETESESAVSQQTDSNLSENAATCYLGHWVSFRPTADITDNGDGTYSISVYWSNSATEGLEWNLKNAVYNSDEDKLSYTDGECVRVVWSNNGEAERTTTDTGLFGYFKLKSDNELSWYDESSGYSSDIVFEKN